MIVTVAALPVGLGSELGVTSAQILTGSDITSTISSTGRVFYSGGDLVRLVA
jgi:hypothetical protein